MPTHLRLTLGEGCTPLSPSGTVAGVLLKRDDLNPSGSHKDRAAAYQVAAAAARGDRAVTISSSGNAAIATSRYAALHGLAAIIFVHPDTDPAKLASIDGTTTTLVVTERAINGAKRVAREFGIANLRPSTSDEALIGYASLGDELAVELPPGAGRAVLFATSGATAIAVAHVLHRRRPEVAVHFVQGAGNAALADPGSTTDTAAARGAAAGRLGVRRSRRARQLTEAIARSGGRPHVVDARGVAAGRALLESDGIVVSDESAANMWVAAELARSGTARVACLVSGAPRGASPHRPRRVAAIDEHAAVELLRPLMASAGG